MESKAGLKLVLTGLLIVLYMAIAIVSLFVFTDTSNDNFVVGLIFDIISFVFIFFFVYMNMFTEKMKIGFYIPTVMVTVVYALFLDVFNIFGIMNIGTSKFILSNLIIIFVYLIICIPMFIAGKK